MIRLTKAHFSFYNQEETHFLKIHEKPEFHPYDFNSIPLLRHISMPALIKTLRPEKWLLLRLNILQV